MISIVYSLSSQEVVMVDVFGDFLHRLLNKGIVFSVHGDPLVTADPRGHKKTPASIETGVLFA